MQKQRTSGEILSAYVLFAASPTWDTPVGANTARKSAVKRQSKECKHKPKEKAEKTKEELSAKEAEEARRKESAVHLGELTKTAREAGMSYGQYMAKKRAAKGEEA